jgi:hypothetical protein
LFPSLIESKSCNIKRLTLDAFGRQIAVIEATGTVSRFCRTSSNLEDLNLAEPMRP